MKNDPVTKVYSNLTDRERAVLYFEYLTRGDDGDLERTRITSTMQMQNFTGLPFDFRMHSYNLKGLAMAYAISYWQHVALAQAMMGGAASTLRQSDDPAKWKPMIKHFEEAEARLFSHELAFDSVCAAHSLDPDTMRALSGERFYQMAHPNLKPVAGYQAALREIFAGMLTTD